MKIFIFLLLFLISSCGYPDIDSVPGFNELKLTDEELYDLCQLTSADKNEIENCIKEKNN